MVGNLAPYPTRRRSDRVAAGWLLPGPRGQSILRSPRAGWRTPPGLSRRPRERGRCRHDAQSTVRGRSGTLPAVGRTCHTIERWCVGLPIVEHRDDHGDARDQGENDEDHGGHGDVPSRIWPVPKLHVEGTSVPPPRVGPDSRHRVGRHHRPITPRGVQVTRRPRAGSRSLRGRGAARTCRWGTPRRRPRRRLLSRATGRPTRRDHARGS